MNSASHESLRMNRMGSWFWTLTACVVVSVVANLLFHPVKAPKLKASAGKETKGMERLQVVVRQVVEPAPEPALPEKPARPPAPVAPNKPPPPPPLLAKAAPVPPAAPTASGSSTTAGVAVHISVDYRSHLGFRAYVKAMEEAGGGFFVYDGQKISACADLLNGRISPVDPRTLEGLSPRSREISDIAIHGCLEKAGQTIGPGYYSIILLIPAPLDDRIQQAALAELQSRKIAPEDIIGVEGQYRPQAAGLELLLTAASLRNGQRVPLDRRIQL